MFEVGFDRQIATALFVYLMQIVSAFIYTNVLKDHNKTLHHQSNEKSNKILHEKLYSMPVLDRFDTILIITTTIHLR